MNALELADWLDEHAFLNDTDIAMQKVSSMLRQQQSEIEFLKKEILEKHEDWKHEGQQAANARAEIEALQTKWLDACDAIIEVGKRKAQE